MMLINNWIYEKYVNLEWSITDIKGSCFVAVGASRSIDDGAYLYIYNKNAILAKISNDIKNIYPDIRFIHSHYNAYENYATINFPKNHDINLVKQSILDFLLSTGECKLITDELKLLI